MKHRITPILLSSAALCVASLSLNAATSGVVGAVSIPVAAGTTAVGLPFQAPIEMQGVVVAASTTSADVQLPAAVPTLEGPHYLQVMTGDVGRIYAIDSYVGDTVTLTRNPLTDITGETVAIRRYLTIGDLDILDGASVTLLNGTAPATNATLFFGAWSPAGVENTIIQPGEGVIINTGTAFPLTVYGSVSTDDVILELDMTGGSYVVGSLNPVDGSGDVLPALVSGLGSGSNMVELLPGVGGGTITYNEFFGWSPDPAGIDVSDYRTVVVTTTPTDIVMPANVIAP